MWTASMAEHAGAAMRRRQRRLRQWLRHERRNGPCRDEPPHSSTGTDEGKGQGRGTSCNTRPRSGCLSPTTDSAARCGTSARACSWCSCAADDSSLQRTVEQLFDIPVPGGGGSVPGLHGFLPRQRSTASPSRKRISERIVEQIVDPVSRGGLHGSSSSHSPAGDEERADEPGKGVFRTFPHIKKVRSWARTRGRNCSPSRAHPRRLLRRRRRWTCCSLSRYSSGRRRKGPGFLSS